jgi:hypothetical protein
MAFLFRLETMDGAPAEPPTLTAAVPNWRPGDTIPLGARMLRVVDVRYDDTSAERKFIRGLEQVAAICGEVKDFYSRPAATQAS